jgi:manganese transport protein
MINRLKNFGPGFLVTAAFIGPGTITTASVAGSSFGFTLLWAVIFSLFATMVLQEMTGRLGLVSRKGLSETLTTASINPFSRIITAILVIAAIAIGNTAFEVGNITGAALGLETLTGISFQVWTFFIGVAAFLILASGMYKTIEKVLIALVVVMSFVFLFTAVIVHPDLKEVMKGMILPTIPKRSLIMIIALIGTTVVPYNLFLHASTVQEKWPESIPLHQALKESRLDIILSITLGGVITLSIIITAASTFFYKNIEMKDAMMMAQQLEPIFGSTARYLFSLGLFAAGLTSSVTAPLAAAYATAGVLGWTRNLKDRRFQAVWITVIAVGTIIALFGQNPVTIIIIAQATNGILLPIIAVFLLVMMNKTDLMGDYRNGFTANSLGIIAILSIIVLGLAKLIGIFGV